MAACSTIYRWMLRRAWAPNSRLLSTCGPHLFNAQQPLSTFSVLGQSLSVMIAANELKSMQMADVLITVRQKYTALDYDKAAEMIQFGYEAAEE